VSAETAVKDTAPVMFAPLVVYRPARGADEIAVTASSAGAVAFEFVAPYRQVRSRRRQRNYCGDWWLHHQASRDKAIAVASVRTFESVHRDVSKRVPRTAGSDLGRHRQDRSPAAVEFLNAFGVRRVRIRQPRRGLIQTGRVDINAAMGASGMTVAKSAKAMWNDSDVTERACLVIYGVAEDKVYAGHQRRSQRWPAFLSRARSCSLHRPRRRTLQR
jgi:hypothetical protein